MYSILTHPDERLRQKSETVHAFDAALEDFAVELEQTMRAGPGGVGIAAPQVGVSKRLIIIDLNSTAGQVEL